MNNVNIYRDTQSNPTLPQEKKKKKRRKKITDGLIPMQAGMELMDEEYKAKPYQFKQPHIVLTTMNQKRWFTEIPQ
jgi:hypothetical protein